MGHDSHSNDHMKVPDWRTYKVEDVPELVSLRRALASQGLKDPWLRNEVWKFTSNKDYISKHRFMTVFRGFKYGLIAAIITSGIEMVLFPVHSHGHDDEHSGDH